MQEYLKNFKKCLQKEIPYCQAECPFHMDILEFIEKIKRGSFKGAFKTYRNAVGFPLIASNLCHEPCKGVCPGKESHRAIELGKLEKACIAFSADNKATDYNLPMKKKKVAVIGSGISGLACALRLCVKKYEVEIFEAEDRIGGSLWELMLEEIFMTDIEEQFKHEKYSIHFNAPVKSTKELEDLGFHAVYVATGKNGNDFGLLEAENENKEKYCALKNKIGWFAGGALVGDLPIYALASGLNMGTVIDNFLKTGNLRYPDKAQQTAMCLNPSKIKYNKPIIAKDGENFNEEEAVLEAERCIECQCDFCRTYCDLTDFYNKWPLRIRDEVLATTLPGAADVKATPAKRLMSTCSQCGLCKETCPEDIDIGGLILEGRKSMHRQKKVPWVFHDFWLRDMDFANSELASISKAGGEFVFFPGCQLGASEPELVKKVYEYLVSKQSDVGLFLYCCGAPAEWSGDQEKHEQEINKIKDVWQKMGKPTFILSCPTCQKKFKTYMEEIPVISLYEIIEKWGFDLSKQEKSSKVSDESLIKNRIYSVFDPCSAGHENNMREAVRNIAKAWGISLEPLPENDENPRCCSFGGQPAIANPEYAEFVTKKRITESENPYITYCINCRDIFAAAGKETVHILDVVFNNGEIKKELATLSQRRENRIELKNYMINKYLKDGALVRAKDLAIRLKISKELKEKLSRERILEEDVNEVVDFCERTGRRIYDPQKDLFCGYKEVGHMTHWVEYRPDKKTESYELVNAYIHRVKIELETVWNGRKIELEEK